MLHYRVHVTGTTYLVIANNRTFQVQRDFLKFSMPDKHNAKEFLNDGYAHDPCNVFPVLDPSGGCVAENFGNETASCEDHGGDFIYSQDLYEETLSTRFVPLPTCGLRASRYDVRIGGGRGPWKSGRSMRGWVNFGA